MRLTWALSLSACEPLLLFLTAQCQTCWPHQALLSRATRSTLLTIASYFGFGIDLSFFTIYVDNDSHLWAIWLEIPGIFNFEHHLVNEEGLVLLYTNSISNWPECRLYILGPSNINSYSRYVGRKRLCNRYVNLFCFLSIKTDCARYGPYP